MRFHLYQAQIERAQQLITIYVTASEERHAREVIADLQITAGQKDFKLERVDEDLPRDRQKGLDSLLETAPAGLASYCEPIGWIAHVIPVPRLYLFRVEEVDREGARAEHHIIAPNYDVATAVYCDCILPPEGEPRLFRIRDGMHGLTDKRGLSALLEFGPVGVVSWDEERGWSMK